MMKKSNMVLLISMAVVIVIIAGVLIISRVLTGNVFSAVESGELTRSFETDLPVETKDYNIKDFNSISTNVMWEIEITKGNTYSVSIGASEELLNKIIVEKRGEVLYLELKSDVEITRTRMVLSAKVTMPALTQLSSSGASSIQFSGFDDPDLNINITGGSMIFGYNNDVTNLSIDCSGAAKIDLESCRIENADLDISGAASVELTMTGGVLSGEVSGAASITYYGEVSSQTIEKSGIASIKNR